MARVPKGRRVEGSPSGEQSQRGRDRLARALSRQGDGEAHDRGLIVERLRWTPQQRLDAHTAFLRLYAELRPDGPLIRE